MDGVLFGTCAGTVAGSTRFKVVNTRPKTARL